MASPIASTSAHIWPAPERGASLLVAFSPPTSTSSSFSLTTCKSRKTVLIVGQQRLAAVRAFSCIEAGYSVVVLPTSNSLVDPEVKARASRGELEILDQHNIELEHDIQQNDEEEEAWSHWINTTLPHHILQDLALAVITDTIPTSSSTIPTRSPTSAIALRNAFYNARIPVNVADYPSISDFHFPATHRFPLLLSTNTPKTKAVDGNRSGISAIENTATASPLQIAITTNGNSCRLASRIKREIVAKLPKGIGSAVAKIGELREQAKKVDAAQHQEQHLYEQVADDDDAERGEREEGWSAAILNRPVPQILQATASSTKPRRLSKCTSAVRRLSLISQHDQNGEKLLQPLLHPSQMPLTPPATPPASSATIINQMEGILAGTVNPPKGNTGEKQVLPPSLTRMRFIAQISEYWPIERLARLSDEEAARVVSLYSSSSAKPYMTAATTVSGENQTSTENGKTVTSTEGSAVNGASAINTSNHFGSTDTNGQHSAYAPRHELSLSNTTFPPPHPQGKIFLLGSGPGSPALLTMAAHTLLTKHATLILSDKLVPSEILALIPSSIPLVIAKKFPGNAEGAQNELMDLAYQGAMRGEIVVRLKQGDPYVYGRGGEEVLFFRERGFESIVVPGISSAFAAPLMAGIPVTQRGVSESVIVTTGVGRKGRGVKLPGYERARTAVVLMGVARLEGVVRTLTSAEGEEGNGREGGGRQGPAYPPYTPIAIIEKASSPDQRLVASTLENIVQALERAGEQRPPGMMIIGWSVLALEGKGDVQVLDEVEHLGPDELEKVDRERVRKWLGPAENIVREGLDDSWSHLVALQDGGSRA